MRNLFFCIFFFLFSCSNLKQSTKNGSIPSLKLMSLNPSMKNFSIQSGRFMESIMMQNDLYYLIWWQIDV
jgi:hypothetical protein